MAEQLGVTKFSVGVSRSGRVFGLDQFLEREFDPREG